MANGYWKTSGSGGVNSAYTAAQLDAMEAGGTLVPDTWYAASDSTIFGLATSASTLARVDFDALALAMAQGIVTDDSETINNKAGIPTTMAALLALAEVNAYPRPFAIYQQGGLGVFTQPAATWTSVTASNNGSGKLRLSSAGIHGLATTGRSIYVGFATTGSGLHEIATVVDTKTLDFTTDFADVSGAVTVYVENTQSKAIDVVCTVPGSVMGPNGSVNAAFLGKMPTASGSRYLYWKLGGTIVSEASWNTTDTCAFGETNICNLGSESAQMATPTRLNAGVSSYTSVAKDTTTDLILSLELRVPTADSYISLDSIRVNVTPGL